MYKKICDLPLPAEQIDREVFNKIPSQDYQYSLMEEVDRRFLFGLIRYFKPRDIIEIGVASGGGSGLILSAIADCEEATLTSIDISTKDHKFKDKDIGFVAKQKYSNSKKWNLIPGKDPSEIIEGLNKKFDFAIIDTAHIHPIETLNFLSVLPFLKDGAVVVLHDISLYLLNTLNHSIYMATRHLFNAVVAKKIVPKKYTGMNTKLLNIGAFQICDDTLSYIDNVFSSLYIPWGITPDKKVLDSVSYIVKKYYAENYAQMFEEAIGVNFYLKCKEYKSINDLTMIMKQYRGQYILFGTRDAEQFIDILNGAGYGLPIEIWDNKDLSFEYNGVTTCPPHFDIPRDVAVVFTVRSQITFNDIVDGWPREIKLQSFFLQNIKN